MAAIFMGHRLFPYPVAGLAVSKIHPPFAGGLDPAYCHNGNHILFRLFDSLSNLCVRRLSLATFRRGKAGQLSSVPGLFRVDLADRLVVLENLRSSLPPARPTQGQTRGLNPP